MNAIALLRPRFRRMPAPARRFEPATARGMAQEGTCGCDWSVLVPALVALGPVLHVDCLPAGGSVHLVERAPWPARSELVGLACARRVAASVALDSDGPRECLHFLDDAGTPVTSIWLLPDSDFLAWERLIDSLPGVSASDIDWWQRLPREGARGSARVRQFQRLHLAGCELIDAVVPTRLSGIGRERARQIAEAAGARLLDVRD